MPKLKWPTHADLAIIKRPAVGREEYLDYMTFQKNDRPLFTEIFGPIVGLKEEWEEQGATPAELDFSAFTYRCEAQGWVPVNAGGRHGGYPEQLLEETEKHKIWRDGLGRKMMLIKGVATLPLPLDYPVRTMDDWLKIKPWYEFSEARLAGDWQAVARRHREENRVVCVGIPGGFNEPRQLLGEEALCIGYYEQPELIHDILQTISDTAFKVLERVVAAVPIDMIEVGEDLAGKSGPLAGPSQVKEFIVPYYRRIWDLLQAHGARLFAQDSDGDINPVIDAFLDAGVNCMYPMEPAANMDIVKLREKYGTRLAFQGGIDKHVLRRSKEEITRELEYKIPPMVRTGGCVIALDHRIPNGTPLENYRFYLSKAWEIMEREAEGNPVEFINKKEQCIMATGNETSKFQKTAAGFVIGIHPRLHVWPAPAPDGIPDRSRLRERIQNGDAHVKAMWERILRAARQAVDDGPIVAVPKTMSADPARTLDRVWALGMAFHGTGDAAYADAARRQAHAMAADWCEWIHPESAAGTLGFAKHSDLRTGMTVHAMGLIYDWFYDQLDAADRELITRAISQRGFARWLKDRTALTAYNSNWCVCIAGGMGVAAMATLETIPESAMIADLAAEHVPRMLEAYGPDGGCEEGAAYWNGTPLLIEYLDALRTATAGRVNHLADPRLRRTCWFPLFFTMPPDGLADFADSYYRGCFRPMAFAAVAAAFRDPALQWACKQAMARGLDHAVPQTLLMYDPSVEALPPGSDAGLSKVFRDVVGWAAIRNGWGDADDRPVIAAKAGDNRHVGMQHLDVGNVIVSAGGGKLLSDHGYGNGRPSWTWQHSLDAQGHSRWNDPLYSTPGHNVVIIGGRNQRLDGVGTVSSYSDDGAVAVVSFNCTGAYEGARSVIRTVLHRRPDLLIVVDAVALERPEPVWLSWHVPAVPVADEHPDESTVAACLPAVRDGLFQVESPRYRLTGMCTVAEGGEAICGAGAHRRFGLIDTFGDYKPMPNTLYPYIRTQSGSARNHLFLSAFLIRPKSMARDAAWIRIKDGLALTNVAHAVQVTLDRSRGSLEVAEPESGWRFQQKIIE